MWNISYTDFDGEDMAKQQLAQHILNHPLLDMREELEAPDVGTLVWFSEKGRPALGRVVQVDPTVTRPLVVHKYRSIGNGTLMKQRFEEIPPGDSGEPNLAHITLYQVRMSVKSLTKGGRLRGVDQQLLNRLLHS